MFQRHFLRRVDSTQSYLREWALRSPLPSGTLVWAYEQYAGYGRRGTRWYASPGESLSFSFLIRSPESPSLLLARVALATYDAIRRYTRAPLVLKWPNDLWSSQPLGKLAGILGEIRWEGEKPVYAIIGVGINVYQKGFPDGLQATSLMLLGGAPPSLEVLLDAFEEALAYWYAAKAAIVRETFVERAWRVGILYPTTEAIPATLIEWDAHDHLHLATPRGCHVLSAAHATELWKPLLSA